MQTKTPQTRFMQVRGNLVALGVFAIASTTIGFALSPVQGKAPKPSVGYASVQPILKNCVACHSGAHPKHGLDLSSYASVVKGDKEGKVVVPGKPADSRLSKAVHHSTGAAPMPPGPTKLPAGDVAKIDAWIKAGAKAK